MQAFSKQKPPLRGGGAWDSGPYAQYLFDQLDNDQLTDAEIAKKSFVLFATAV